MWEWRLLSAHAASLGSSSGDTIVLFFFLCFAGGDLSETVGYRPLSAEQSILNPRDRAQGMPDFC